MLRKVGVDWVFPSCIQDLFEGWHIFKTSRKARTLWSLVCPAVCWSIWLERNQRIFENQSKPTYIVYRKDKDRRCFWQTNCKEVGKDSFVNTKRGWRNIFKSQPSLHCLQAVGFFWGLLIPLMNFSLIKNKSWGLGDRGRLFWICFTKELFGAFGRKEFRIF